MLDDTRRGAHRARPWEMHRDYWVRSGLLYPRRPLYDIIDTAAIDFGDQTATSFFGATLTFRDIKMHADRLAAVLAQLGIVRGDRLGIMLPNCPQYFFAVFAVLRHGAIVVNINPTYTEREVLAIAADSGLRFVLTLDVLAPQVLRIRQQTALETIIITSLDEYGPSGTSPTPVAHTLRLADLLAEHPSPPIVRAPVAPDDVAVLQYTGGTTGLSKGAMLTHRSLFANVIQNEAVLYRPAALEAPRYVMVIPFFHVYAFTVGILTGLWVGAVQALIPKYDVEQVLCAIRDFHPTYFPAVPTVFVSILNHPRAREYGLDRVRYYNSGGAPCSVEVIEQFEQTFGRPLNEGYGLTETSPVTHFTPYLAERRIGTVGLPLPDTDLKVVDAETGTQELAPGEVGELCIAGPQVMKGYWNRPDETSQALRPDETGRVWLYTGDLARIDEDGFTTIVQRKKDMILVDGFNVYPSEIETVLYMHAAVRLVAVVGVPDRYHGEIVKAYVVLKDGTRVSAADLIAHCATALAPYKVPQVVEIRESLPTSAVGKILHRVLREEARAAAQS